MHELFVLMIYCNFCSLIKKRRAILLAHSIERRVLTERQQFAADIGCDIPPNHEILT